MELIFAIVDRSGRIKEQHKISGDSISIGRAFDNDLVLVDPAVSPHHALIVTDENDQPVLTDTGSLNGISIGGKQRLRGRAGIVSGQTYVIGKTRVRIYAPDHPVADAISLGRLDKAADTVEVNRIFAALLLTVLLVYAGEQWLNMFSGFKWREMANVLLTVFGGVLALGVFWAVVGRILRQETNFRIHTTIILVFILAQFLLIKLFNLLLFNTLDYPLSMLFFIPVEFLLIGLMLWFNLALAANQSDRHRLVTAAALSTILMILSYYTEIISDSGFSDKPEYVKILHPSVFLLRSGISKDRFLTEASTVFEKLDDE